MGLTAIDASLRPDEFSTDPQLRPSPLVYRKRTYDTGQNTPKSQYFQYLTDIQRKATQKSRNDENRMNDLVERVDRVISYSCADLPVYIEQLANDFPELCLQNPPFGGKNPLDSLKSGGDGLDIIRELLQDLKIGADQTSAYVIEERLSGHKPASAETLAVSRQLQKRWDVACATGVIMAPGRLNRLSCLPGCRRTFSIHVPMRP